MSHVEWRTELSTGIRSIDLQHCEWLSMANDFISLHQAGQSSQALDDLLPSLQTYSLFHFSEEEALLSRVASGTEMERLHVLQHSAFAQAMDAWSQRRLTIADTETAQEVGCYLQSWLTRHIAGADQELARLVRLHDRRSVRPTALEHHSNRSYDSDR